LQLRPMAATPVCPWLLAEPGLGASTPKDLDASRWALKATVIHLADKEESVLVFQRK
jgi:hypothetical protein